jgi:hypothetical protein
MDVIHVGGLEFIAMKAIFRGLLLLFVLPGTAFFSSCTNAEGRFRPPDPLGRAIFDALDPGPRQPSTTGISDEEFLRRSQSPGPDYVWVDGAYGQDSRGQRVWVPGRWVRP